MPDPPAMRRRFRLFALAHNERDLRPRRLALSRADALRDDVALLHAARVFLLDRADFAAGFPDRAFGARLTLTDDLWHRALARRSGADLREAGDRAIAHRRRSEIRAG